MRNEISIINCEHYVTDIAARVISCFILNGIDAKAMIQNAFRNLTENPNNKK